MRFLQLALMLVILLGACSSGGNRQPDGVRHPNVIYVGGDTGTGTSVATSSTTGTGQGTSTALTTGTSVLDAGGMASGEVGVSVPGSDAARCVSENPFPSCQGTPDQVSECIVNIPSRFGLVVTSPEPMDFSACKP